MARKTKQACGGGRRKLIIHLATDEEESRANRDNDSNEAGGDGRREGRGYDKADSRQAGSSWIVTHRDTVRVLLADALGLSLPLLELVLVLKLGAHGGDCFPVGFVER